MSGATTNPPTCARCAHCVEVPRYGRLPDMECRRYPTPVVVSSGYKCGEFLARQAPAADEAES